MKEFLRQEEAHFFAQTNQEFELIERTNGLARQISPTQVDDQRAVWDENTLELAGKIQKLFHIVLCALVAILFLPSKSKRRRRQNEIDCLIGNMRKKISAISPISRPQVGLEIRSSRLVHEIFD
jgi:hypothetical protein